MPAIRLKISLITAAIRDSKGDLSVAAEILGISRTRLSELIEHRSTLKRLELEMEESRIDQVEAKLFKMIDDGDFRSVSFFLKTKGGARGYSDNAGDKRYGPVTVISTIPRPDYSKPYDDNEEDEE